MSQTTWSRKALKRFEVSRSGDKMEYFFAASLAIVIILALVLTIYVTFFKGEAGAEEASGYMWKCMKCGAEFSVDEKTQRLLEEANPPRADCPECGAVASAIQMTKCPACGKYFVREDLINRRVRIDEVTCPYCGKNWLEAIDEKAGVK